MHQVTDTAIALPAPSLQLTLTPKQSEDELHRGSLYYLVESGTTFVAMISPFQGLFWVTFRDGQTVKCADLPTAIATAFEQAGRVVEAAQVEPAEAVDLNLYSLGYQAALNRAAYSSHPSFRQGFGDGMAASRLPLPTSPEPLCVRGWGDELLNHEF